MALAIRNRWGVFALASIFFILSQFYRASMAVISSDLIRDLQLNASDLSLLSSVFFYAFALVQIPIGLTLDRFGPRLTMSVLSLFGLAGALCFAWSDTLGMAIWGRLLLGLGMACNLMGPFKLLTLWFSPKQFASLTTLIFSIGTAGNLAATSPLVLVVQGVGWRWAFTLIAAFHAVLILVFMLMIRDHPPDRQEHMSAPVLDKVFQGLRALLKSRDYWLISLGTFCRYGVYAAIQTLWAGPYLMNGLGLSPLLTGNIILLMNLGFILSGPLWGSWSDRLGYRKRFVLMGLLSMAGIMIFLNTLSLQTSIVLFCVLFVAFGAAGSTGGIMYTQIKERMPDHLAATAMTGINLFTMIGAAGFSHGLGLLMQSVHGEAALSLPAFQMIFRLCAGCLLTVFCLYCFTREDATANTHAAAARGQRSEVNKSR